MSEKTKDGAITPKATDLRTSPSAPPLETGQDGAQAEVQLGPEIIIRPPRGWSAVGLGDVWDHRELMFFLLWREVKGKYRQMAFGPLWIIIQPLVMMVIFSLIFGRLAKLSSEGVPYLIFAYVALLPWQFFANATRNSANSLVSQLGIMSKVYYPRMIIPISAVISAFIEFMASLLILIGMMAVFKVMPSWWVLTLPYFLLLSAASALAIGLWLAALAVRFRDVALGLGFAITVGMYISPVAYSSTLIPERFQVLYKLNPMAGVIDGFRWALLEAGPTPDWTLAVSSLGVLFLIITGAFHFRRTERSIVDLI